MERGLPHVEVPELGTGYAFGPLEVATAQTVKVGSRVLVASIGAVKEDLVVIGVVVAPAP